MLKTKCKEHGGSSVHVNDPDCGSARAQNVLAVNLANQKGSEGMLGNGLQGAGGALRQGQAGL